MSILIHSYWRSFESSRWSHTPFRSPGVDSSKPVTSSLNEESKEGTWKSTSHTPVAPAIPPKYPCPPDYSPPPITTPFFAYHYSPPTPSQTQWSPQHTLYPSTQSKSRSQSPPPPEESELPTQQYFSPSHVSQTTPELSSTTPPFQEPAGSPPQTVAPNWKCCSGLSPLSLFSCATLRCPVFLCSHCLQLLLCVATVVHRTTMAYSDPPHSSFVATAQSSWRVMHSLAYFSSFAPCETSQQSSLRTALCNWGSSLPRTSCGCCFWRIRSQQEPSFLCSGSGRKRRVADFWKIWFSVQQEPSSFGVGKEFIFCRQDRTYCKKFQQKFTNSNCAFCRQYILRIKQCFLTKMHKSGYCKISVEKCSK